MPNRGNNSFIPKLTSMIQTHPHLINWIKQGTEVEIMDVRKFREELHPIYFPKSNYPSFVRQLSMYGFSKLTTKRNTLTIRHHRFRKGNQNIFNTITRKQPQDNTPPLRTLPYNHKKDQGSKVEEPPKTPSFQQMSSTEEVQLPITLPPIPQTEIHNALLALINEATDKGKEIVQKLAQQIYAAFQERRQPLRSVPSFVSFGRIPQESLVLESHIQSLLPLQPSLGYMCEEQPFEDEGLI